MKTIRWGIIGVGNVTEVKSGPTLQKAEHSALVAVMRLNCPTFETYWAKSDVSYHFAARPLTPLALKPQNTDLLQFRVMAEPFIQDRRFRVIYYLPADPVTMQQCLDWSAEKG